MQKGMEDTSANHRLKSQGFQAALPLDGHFQLDLRHCRRVTREKDARFRVFVTMHLEERKIENAACRKNFLFPEVHHVNKECGHFQKCFANPP